MTTENWSMDSAIVEMADAGAFGLECAFVSFKLDSQYTKMDQFRSTIHYGIVTVCDHDDLYRCHKIVVKVNLSSDESRSVFNSDIHFHNEIYFYEQIMPFLLSCIPADGISTKHCLLSFCHYFNGLNRCGEFAPRDIIVLENACSRGYRSSNQRLHLDIDHLVVALKTLAKFHALSYRAKHKDPVVFAKMIHNVKDTQWGCDNEWILSTSRIKGLFSVILDRIIERNGGKEDEKLRRFRKEYLDDVIQTIRNVMEPMEPLNVLCHGDFNRNNMLFLYDENGQPMDTLAFDMATVRYGSPALDLSFFLYMNTDRQTRDAHWDNLLDTYCTSLAAAVSDIADVVRVPDREQLDTEIRKRAFYGLTHVTFFVRIIMEDHKNFSQCAGKTDDEILKLEVSFGGENATDVIADAVQHFIGIRYASMS